MVRSIGNLLWEHRYGLIGTLFLHLGLILYSFNKTVLPYVPIFQEEIVEVDFIDESQIPPEQDPLRQQETQTEEVTNTAFNREDSREASEFRYDSRFNKSSLDEQVERELREFEAAEFKKLQEGRAGQNNGLPDPDVVPPDPNKNKKNQNPQEQGSSSGGIKGKTTVEYDLPGRRDERLPIPAYRCIGNGLVVVRVKVSRDGKVQSARIDTGMSSYSEECMANDAMNFAKRTKFNASASASDPQEGTITYRYIAQ